MTKSIFLSCAILSLILNSMAAIAAERCPDYQPGQKRVYWGDLHVHSGYSLDAWGYGTISTPADAYAFARGAPLQLTSDMAVRLNRPLDFMAVTDHAEWFDLLYICTDPGWSDDPYCDVMTEQAGRLTGSAIFTSYVNPTITEANPSPTELCLKDPSACDSQRKSQWLRIQEQTNHANAPCEFTALHGYEWSATPDYSHNHRNVIFRSDAVTPDPVDYLRHPTPLDLWQGLEKQCLPENGCEALAIPHNTNMGDGKSFDVETESDDVRLLRARYEKLIEIHQEKGSSECLYAYGAPDEDCNFEHFLTLGSRAKDPADFTQAQWQKMRSTYARALLTRGLGVYEETGLNPLQLGIIGSTDNHAGTGGFTDEDQWQGSVFGLGDIDRTMTRLAWNPGGLVGVWAEENTRAGIFDALKAREVFATSGPRIQVRLDASAEPLSCTAASSDAIPMGGELQGPVNAPYFRVQALYDETPLQSIELIKGELRDGQLREQTISVWHKAAGDLNVCISWQDPGFDPAAPAFWYARVLQAPTLRWSAHRCRGEGRCTDFPGAEKTLRERAWSSPIWHLP